MATFDIQFQYSLNTYTVIADLEKVVVKHTSSGKTAKTVYYTAGIDLKVISNNFCIGTITFTNSNTVDINVGGHHPLIEFVPDGGDSLWVGNSNSEDPTFTTHTWMVGECPIRVTRSGNTVTMRYPCSGSPCQNTCYSTSQ